MALAANVSLFAITNIKLVRAIQIALKRIVLFSFGFIFFRYMLKVMRPMSALKKAMFMGVNESIFTNIPPLLQHRAAKKIYRFALIFVFKILSSFLLILSKSNAGYNFISGTKSLYHGSTMISIYIDKFYISIFKSSYFCKSRKLDKL